MNVVRVQRTFLLKNANRFKKKLLNWAHQKDTLLWLDSNNYKDAYSQIDAVLALGKETECVGKIPTAFQSLEHYIATHRDWLFGYLSYDLKNEIEALSSQNFDALSFPDLYFFQPRKLFFFSGNRLTMAYLEAYEHELKKDFNQIRKTKPNAIKGSDQEFNIKSRLAKDDYLQNVQSLLGHIQRGDIYETNFCQEFYTEGVNLPILATYYNLNSISKPPYAALLKFNEHVAISASPERYLKKTGQKLLSQPIKGTAKRSQIPAEDKILKQRLEHDHKERSENIMIVDLVRNDLSKTAQKGSVTVEELCKVYSFKQVHQMISTVSSRLKPNTSLVEIFKTTFPMGSMTGAPKISAMKLAEHYETTKRGLYSGAIGYITPEADFDFNVVIRSILYNSQKQYVSFSVGGAITAKSDPESEYEECLIKAKALREVLEGKK